MPADLITLSREYGAGASELASLLGERLGWRVLDSEIPLAAARRLGVSADSLEDWDEHAPGLLESLGNALLLGSPELLVDPAVAARPHARDVADATTALLREAAEDPPLIVVGHGAQSIFAHRPHTIHVRLVAPLPDRIHKIMTRRSVTEQEARIIAAHVDRDRAMYVKDFLHRDVRDPLLYSLQINTGKVAMADAVELVTRLVQSPY
ncbi:MAG TPA: cytidylate kinase-like family protein [Gemmatimonadaceae bacterium]